MWRITDDFWDKWELLYNMFERAEKWCTHTGAGHFPDADMLPVGPILQDYGRENRTKFTENEQVTMLTLWSIFRSPLIIGGEMTGFDDFTMKLLTNEAVLKMHSNARHSHQVWRKTVNGNEFILWTAADCEGGHYSAVFNAGDTEGTVDIPLTDLELYSKVKACELWSGESFEADGTLSVKIGSHGAKAFRMISAQ